MAEITEFHLSCNPDNISRYVFCPGDQRRAKKIAAHFSESRKVLENRGYLMFSGYYQDIFMTVIGTGMGGPAVAIALEELGHMGADTFIRIGSCGVYQDGQRPGDVIISSGVVRMGGTANAYLPPFFPAVPHFQLLRALVNSAEALKILTTIGVGVAGDAFYDPHLADYLPLWKKAGVVYIEMESDTLFIISSYHGWQSGVILVSDGSPTEIKPAWGLADFTKGEDTIIQIGLDAMLDVARTDRSAETR
jgi:uridine phosphorylase